MTIRDGEETTDVCDHCAQELVAELAERVKALEQELADVKVRDGETVP
jgi:hypothetical protein